MLKRQLTLKTLCVSVTLWQNPVKKEEPKTHQHNSLEAASPLPS